MHELACTLSSGAMFITSPRGNRMIKLGNHIFYKNKVVNEKGYWICCCKKTGCKAKVTTFSDVILQIDGTHTHV